jgi:hypothetical protein
MLNAMQIFITYDIIWHVNNITGVKKTMINFVDVVLKLGEFPGTYIPLLLSLL